MVTSRSNIWLNISFTELNGLSDVEEISVSLADNIVSDRLTLIWNSTSGQCTSETSHLLSIHVE